MDAMKYPFLVFKGGRDPAACLFESEEFKARAPWQRVVSSTFKPHGFGDFRLHANVAAMCEWVERTAGPGRNFNIVILEDQPVRMYLDLDMATTADTRESRHIELMLGDVRAVLEDAFASAYPAHHTAAAGLGSDRWWYFSASNSTKASYHLHADPDSPHPVWSSATELGVFMKRHVRPLLEREWLAGEPRARRLALNAAEGQDPHSLNWFIDFSVYSRQRSLKMPLCRKPGKTAMTLLRAPAGVQDTSERKQLKVGMPQVWADSEAAAAALQLLPDLTSSSARTRTAAGTGGAAAGTRYEAKAASAFAGSDKDEAQRAAIVLQLLQPANVGPAARWSSFEVSVAARTADGTLAKQSARCPWKEGIHNSNQLKVSIKNGQLHVS